VRRTDGSNHKLPSLNDLTRLIAEGTFTRDDEVSRTGKAWRRLGDIEELESFFAEADRRGPSRIRKATQGPVLGLIEPKAAQAAPTERSAGHAADPTPTVPIATVARANGGASRPSGVSESWRDTAPRSASKPEAGGGETDDGRASDDDEVATEQRALPNRTSAAASVNPLSAPLTRGSAAEASRARVTPPMAAGVAEPAVDFPDLDDRSPEGQPRSRSSLVLWLFALVSTALAISTWLLWPMPPHPRQTIRPEDPSGQFLARADEAFATHRIEHFEQAITEYTKTLAFHENDAHVLSSLSRVYAVWTQELRFKQQADDREPEKTKDVARRATQVANASQAQQLAEKAKGFAETAARKNPGNGEAEVALSDALRLTNNLVGARSELDHALATDKDPNAETLRVAALLAIDEAGGDARAGLALASQACAKEPELLRTQILLARCLVGDGDLVGARYHLRAVTTRDRDHPSALAVERLIELLSETSASRDAAVAQGDKPAVDEPPVQYDNLSHEGYITRGQTLLEAGQVSAAKRMFEQALFIRPNSSQAHTGLGYVALEKGRPQLAAEHFVAAARAGNDDALIGLGDAYRRLQRPRDALRAYQNYLTHNPNGRQVSIARAQVERLSEEAQVKKTQ
jgi:tetratricopeptide (TPR) repeat protein